MMNKDYYTISIWNRGQYTIYIDHFKAKFRELGCCKLDFYAKTRREALRFIKREFTLSNRVDHLFGNHTHIEAYVIKVPNLDEMNRKYKNLMT